MSRRPKLHFIAADNAGISASRIPEDGVHPADSFSSSLPPSKSQRKRDMHDVQSMGEALVALSVAKLTALALPERLFDAIIDAKSITRHEARRRQLQFIGKLMRGIDTEPIRTLLLAEQSVPSEEKARMALLEDWRRRLLEGDAALDQLADRFPDQCGGGERETWARRIDEARREQRAGDAAPRHYRALFKALRALFFNVPTAEEHLSNEFSPPSQEQQT